MAAGIRYSCVQVHGPPISSAYAPEVWHDIASYARYVRSCHISVTGPYLRLGICVPGLVAPPGRWRFLPLTRYGTLRLINR
jgi:hypothetical protein